MNEDIYIAFVGDFAFPFNTSALSKIDLIKEIIGVNIVVANLESSICTQDKYRKLINIYSTSLLKQFMITQGIKIVSLANNHVMDYGRKGLQQLIDLLSKSKVNHCGAGMNLSEATKPVEIRIKNSEWAFISYAWPLIESISARNNKAGVAPLEKNLIIQNIQKLKGRKDEICVICHWGYEYEKYPLPAHRRLAHMLIDTGATLIIGHHPHRIQGIEYYKGKMIAYSLGNFFLPLESYLNIRTNSHKRKHKGLVIKYNVNSPEQSVYFTVEYNSITHTLKIKNATDCFLSELAELSQPLKFNDKKYVNFFIKNRVRHKLLPVFTGGRFDILRLVWLKVRGQGIQIVVRLINVFNHKLKKKGCSND